MESIESFHFNIFNFLDGLTISRCRCLGKIYSDPQEHFWKPELLSNKLLVKYYNGFYQKIFGKDKIICRLIHHDEDICFNSGDREILYTIQKFLNNKLSFKEIIFGKCIYGSIKLFREAINNSFSINLDLLYNFYQDYFEKRIKNLYSLLLSTYPSLKDNQHYQILRSLLPTVVNKSKSKDKQIDFSPFYEYRNQWEELRKELDHF